MGILAAKGGPAGGGRTDNRVSGGAEERKVTGPAHWTYSWQNELHPGTLRGGQTPRGERGEDVEGRGVVERVDTGGS